MNQVVLITGGTRGVGRAIANRFALMQATLILTYLQNTEAAEAAQYELIASGARCRSAQHTYAKPLRMRTSKIFVAKYLW